MEKTDKIVATNGILAYPCRPLAYLGSKLKLSLRRDGRAVEGARLESVYTATYRGFESLSLRQTIENIRYFIINLVKK
jgi:hypothetical protein